MELYPNDDLGIRKYFLMNSSPDVVYSFIKENATKRTEVPSTCNSFVDCENILLKRDHPLINLALAQYGCSKEIFNTLYSSECEEIRIALLNNPVVFHEGTWRNDSWMSLEDVEKLIKKNHYPEIAAFFKNSWIDSELLKNLYQRKSIFSGIEEKKWRVLIAATGNNKRISADYESIYGLALTSSASWVEYAWDALFDKIWNLAFTVPVNRDWAIVLSYLFSKTKPEVNSDYDIASALERWSIQELKEAAEEANFFGGDPFGETRFYLARLYNIENINFKNFKNSNDKIFRASFYERFMPHDCKELRECYENEKIEDLFLNHALKNENLFKSEDIRNEFYRICSEENVKKNYESSWTSLYNHFLEKHKAAHPVWFKTEKEDDDRFYCSSDWDADLSEENIIEKKIDVTKNIVKKIIKKCNSIDEKTQDLKDFFFGLVDQLNFYFWIFFIPSFAYYISKKFMLNFFQNSVSTIIGILTGIIALILSIRKLVKEDIKKKENLKSLESGSV